MSKSAKKKQKKLNKARKKIGVNDPCPCGSGIKYKRCCLNKISPENTTPIQLKQIPLSEAPPELLKLLEDKKVLERQRIDQQGHGRPIISMEFKGRRLVAIGNKIFDSGNCKTFHEVLPVYLREILGEEWVKEELKKELSSRHPILQWHHSMVIYQKEKIENRDKVQTIPMTGAVAALLGLAYNVYHIAHNSALQEKLINRLKDFNQFLGACYETQVVAYFIQAGFEIDFENEDDPSSTHCEFIAKHRKSGRRFSVEAKARTPGKENANISNQLHSALKKNADHERIIFIDINVSEKTTGLETTKWIKEAIHDLREAEKRLKVDGKDAPPAYVFLTNHQSAYNLNNTNFDIAALAESFKIPDFQIDAPFTSLRAAIDSRDRHKEVIDLFESIKKHHKIPSTFDGEIPEFAFGGEAINQYRLIVGEKYVIPDENGNDAIGTLLDPVVIVEKGKHFVHAIYELQNGGK